MAKRARWCGSAEREEGIAQSPPGRPQSASTPGDSGGGSLGRMKRGAGRWRLAGRG